jgi:hypothetical protein
MPECIFVSHLSYHVWCLNQCGFNGVHNDTLILLLLNTMCAIFMSFCMRLELFVCVDSIHHVQPLITGHVLSITSTSKTGIKFKMFAGIS